MEEIADMNQTVPDTSKLAVGRRLMLTREARGWSQVQLANLLKVSPQKWNTYERGVAMIQPALLAKFCAISGATSDWILLDSMTMLPMALNAKINEIIERESDDRKSQG